MGLNGPYMSLIVFMDSNLSLCVLIGLFAFLWVLTGPYRSVCVLIHFNGSL